VNLGLVRREENTLGVFEKGMQRRGRGRRWHEAEEN
jgi:hypothetical protein